MSNTSASGGYLTPINSVGDDLDLDILFQNLIVGLTGLNGSLVLPRFQPVIKKQIPQNENWIAVGVKDDSPDDNPSSEHLPNANSGLGRDELSRQERIEVLVSFYGPNSKSYAKIVRDGLFISQNRDVLTSQGIVFIVCGKIIAAHELINESWIKRYDMLMSFNRTVNRLYDIQNLDSAEVIIYNESQTLNIEIEQNA